jgi:RNA polymerase subunit RPABC4/transcription elongation factor Spt4
MNWNNVSLVVLGLAAFFGAFFVALWASLVIWTFRDMRARTRDAFAQFLASLMVLALGPFGIVLYFILRPRETLAEKFERSLEEEALLQDIEERQICPGCKQPIQPDYVLCPICHTRLRAPCIHCGRLIHPRWNLCPYCAQGQEPIPGLDRAGKVTLQDLEAEPAEFALDEGQVPELAYLASDSREAQAEELPQEMMAELRKEADASVGRASYRRASIADAQPADVRLPDADEIKRTRQLRASPADTQEPPQPAEPKAADQTAEPADAEPEKRTRQPLSLFRRR